MNRMLSYLSGLIGLALVLSACGPGGATLPPDTQATEAAAQEKIDEAVAATLAAQVTPAQAEVSPVASTDITAAEATPLPADTPLPTLATEPAAPPTAAPVEATCTVVSTGLNVRSGPGLVYAPLTSLPGQTQLIPIGFNGAGFPGRWVLVEVPANNLTGWVSADPQFIDCSIDVAGLPLAEAPPTPTPTNTSTPLPTPPSPTPTPIDFFVFSPEGGGGNRENIKGQLLIPPGYVPDNSDPLNLVFREGLTFRVEVYDVRSGRTSDGADIRRVEFFIDDDERGEVYSKAEESPAYCLFSGDDPLCPGLRFSQNGYTWPNGTPLRNTKYNATVVITSERGDDANWRFSFRVEGAPAEPSELVAAIAQTGPNTTDTIVYGTLAFQVEAYDPDRGTSDGDGIDSVDLQIFRNGQKVYERTERSAGYCAFSGGEPDCQLWVFADRNNQWPGDRPIEFGPHLLRAQVNAKNGQKKVIELQVDLQP